MVNLASQIKKKRKKRRKLLQLRAADLHQREYRKRYKLYGSGKK